MKKSRFTNFIIIVIFFSLLLLVYILAGNGIDRKFNDKFIKILTLVQKKHADNKVVLIAIDDKSTNENKWPWSRDYFAKLFNFLEKKAKVIVFNNLVIFPDTYNKEADIKFFESINKSENLINTYILTNSNILGDVIPSDYDLVFDKKANVKIKDERTNKIDFSYNGIVKMPKPFLDNAHYFASSILPIDKDDIVRTYMSVVMYNNKFYPSIALSAYAMYMEQSEFILRDKYLCSIDNCKTLKIPFELRQIKDNFANKVKGLVSYYNWIEPFDDYYSHKVYSAIDILKSIEAIENGEKPLISADEFENKIVIIGLNSPKNKWEQTYKTPILNSQSEIDIHAVMIDNMLSNTFKTMDNKIYTHLITIVFCFLILRGFKNFRLNIIFTTILAVLYIIYYFVEYMIGIYTAIVSPIFTMYIAAILKKLYSIMTTDKTAEMIKHAMGKYISKDVMNKVISNLDKLKLGGTRTVVTIFFIDIRNFTKISEELPPNEVTSILNEYFSTIEPIIAKYHGIVNKYIGDGLLAVFGEPVKNKGHALNAVLCGIEIIEQMNLLKEKFLKENKPVINVGIGVNTGEVFAGNIGTEERFEYTIIGDNVNLASRIEAYNQILKTQFLISEYTYEFVKDKIDVVKLSGVNIKGKSKPIDIYEVLRLKK